ncbi:YdbH domain-containing protein [Porphyrobacter sp. YT40]|uniref:intermembrane phospholipid transport protein YdbH family protein n=1 Tax=Porphyrobacter sp. YT40 TaxID=2547601 RepID=UPI0011419408|nr:YdbH domain-containing protein [Porphyrobacter sp. YT40]QDH34629.1 exoprotein [Porphyrobacter sp. YT40]
MPVAEVEQDGTGQRGGRRRVIPQRWPARLALGVATAALLGVGALWLSRERIAGDLIDGYLADNGVPATYDIVSIGPRQQVIENLVIGDPARPDLTVRRVTVDIGVGWAGPEVRKVSVEGARAFASYRGGTFSLGALDPLVFTGSDAAPALSAIDIAITDARALVESDYGRIGVKLEGAGRLDDGFAGTLAATAPGIGTPDCRAERATLYGALTTDNGAPLLDGPLRLGGIACGGARLGTADIGTRARLDKDFTTAEIDFAVTGERATYAALTGRDVEGSARLNWAPERLTLAHDLSLLDVTAPQGSLARLGAEGSWRGSADGSRGQWEGTLRGAGLVPANNLTTSLAVAERGAEGTLVAPLLKRLRGGLTRALDQADFRADATLRHKAGEFALIVSDASLADRRGARVLALSRVSAGIGESGLTGLRGNILVGGADLPNLDGRMAQDSDGSWSLRLAMADYAAGPNHLAIPRLTLRGGRSGAIGFDGVMTASGILPGGGVSDLTVPIEGGWSSAGGLAMGTRCTPLGFAKLALSGLALDRQSITLCPESGGGAMLAWRDGLRLAARTGPLTLAGQLGESPAKLAAQSLMLRYPGPFVAEEVDAVIGSGSSEVQLTAASLSGGFGSAIAGEFAGGSARLAAVPFDLDALSGRWAFADGALDVTGGAFTLSDRPAAGALARFEPLAAEDARLTLVDGRITADAELRAPASRRSVAQVTIAHDLATATGSARLSVPGVVFDKSLQPEDLSYLAKGVIAFADGTITGEGRIDWRGEDITSSGTFASDGFDFAAAFGPVRGVAGQVVFTDLLNLTTAPDQRLRIAAINPGVEVLGGSVQFELKDGTLLALEDARFPFMRGTLLMRPLTMDFSRPEERRYVFEIMGLDAAAFVAQMELGNISATGVFDGTVPIIFDANGNGRIEGGLLIARPGGGNVAYLGELSYENLGTMGNYAFSALRSLDYRQMSVTLDGDLAGEIITGFNFDGIRQGAGASRNFITRRLAKLPIQFRISVRSETFSQLAYIARGYSDPAAWGDPVAMGLFRIENGKLVPRDPALVTPSPATPEP